jgi:hypothetical protein
MAAVTQVSGYDMSRDYTRLAEIMQQRSVVCLVDFDEKGVIRDVAKTIFDPNAGRPYWMVSSRGIADHDQTDEQTAIYVSRAMSNVALPTWLHEEGKKVSIEKSEMIAEQIPPLHAQPW